MSSNEESNTITFWFPVSRDEQANIELPKPLNPHALNVAIATLQAWRTALFPEAVEGGGSQHQQIVDIGTLEPRAPAPTKRRGGYKRAAAGVKPVTLGSDVAAAKLSPAQAGAYQCFKDGLDAEAGAARLGIGRQTYHQRLWAAKQKLGLNGSRAKSDPKEKLAEILAAGDDDEDEEEPTRPRGGYKTKPLCSICHACHNPEEDHIYLPGEISAPRRRP